ncbi:MAG: HAMP domain-containing sensor histidine kinase [Planctomycetota bacterium]|nr:HAMP domain-containing sensor histidine kinase [Planctomycetota bacterium]
MTIAHQPTAGKQPTMLPSAFLKARSHQESLRSKIVLSVAGIFLLFVATDEVVRQQLIQPKFDEFVEFKAAQDEKRVLATLNRESEYLSVLSAICTSQIQAGQIHADGSRSTWKGDFTTKILHEHADWIATISPTGQWRWIAKDIRSGSPEATAQALQSVSETLIHSGHNSIHGITPSGRKTLALFSLTPLQPPTGEQTSVLLVARNLDSELLDSIRRRTQVAFTLLPPSLGNRVSTAEQADEFNRIVEIPTSEAVDNQLGNLTLKIPRQFAASSRHTTRLARSVFLLGCVLAFLILLHRLHRIVIRPLTKIHTQIKRFPQTESNPNPLVCTSEDEITDLANAFDELVHRLQETEKQPHRAPKENKCLQVASSVIHNVENVQTNVNSLIEAACERTRRLRISPLNKLAERLRSGEPDAEMLEATPDYLEHLAGSLQSDQQSISELLCTLNENVRHIREIIRVQQQTDPSLKICSIQIRELIEDAVACCCARLEADAVGVSIGGQLEIEVRSDRSLMLQTMINLISNARHALRAVDSTKRLLAIYVRQESKRIEIDFQDNGCGIKPEILDRIFNSRFTTRETGTGLGLHFCAVTLERLGGSIRAASDGFNQGSVFTIEIPTSIFNPVHSPQTTTLGTTS